MANFTRKRLLHELPAWVTDGQTYFITINCKRRHTNTLTKPDVAPTIKTAVQHYTSIGKWYPRLIVLMPDHLHGLFSLNTREHGIAQIFSSWKSYLKKAQGIDWQGGFFEHRIRNEDSLEQKAHYLRQNPVRAELVENPEEWPYIWNSSDFLR